MKKLNPSPLWFQTYGITYAPDNRPLRVEMPTKPPSWWQEPVAFEKWRREFFGYPSGL